MNNVKINGEASSETKVGKGKSISVSKKWIPLYAAAALSALTACSGSGSSSDEIENEELVSNNLATQDIQFENQQIQSIPDTLEAQDSQTSQNEIFSETDEIPSCASNESDPDGDGWGEENGESCRVTPQPNQGIIVNSNSLETSSISDKTTVNFIYGQSNVVNAGTKYVRSLDGPKDGVIAWQQGGYWDNSDPESQYWYPEGVRPYSGGAVNNSLIHQIGRELTNIFPNNDAYIVAGGVPGASLAELCQGSSAFAKITEHWRSAYYALPENVRNNATFNLYWGQGEANENMPTNIYFNNLETCLTDLQTEIPFSFDNIIGLTLPSLDYDGEVNTAIRQLGNHDGNPITDVLEGAHYGTYADHGILTPDGRVDSVHWPSESIRPLGREIAQKISVTLQ